MYRPFVSVIIPCHNYAHFLSRCLQSVIGQTSPVDEIIVVDDSSSDHPERIVELFAERKVRCLRVNFGSPFEARRAGFEASFGDIVCFLDADDALDPFYIENGLKHFEEDYRVAVVYSDVLFDGLMQGRSNYPPSTEFEDLSRTNFIHTGALVRRDALLVADGFRSAGPPDCHEDWGVWRRVIEAGYRGVKQESLYLYRKHEDGLSHNRHYGRGGYTYYQGAALAEEPLTLVLPLSGNPLAWSLYSHFLQRQQWNHERVRLLLIDGSSDRGFASSLRRWITDADYPDVCCLSDDWIRDTTGASTGGNRTFVSDDLGGGWLSWPSIVHYAASVADTNYLLFLEEDIIAPLDVCEGLFKSFCQDTFSVCGVYKRPGYPCFAAWDSRDEPLSEGTGVQNIRGNGFGCTLMRTAALKDVLGRLGDCRHDFAKRFYANVSPERLVKINWEMRCQTLGTAEQKPQTNLETTVRPFSSNLFQSLIVRKPACPGPN